MADLANKIFIGYITEIIHKSGKPTLELRVRIPSVHGASGDFGLKDADLPIAKPMFTPGTYISSERFEAFIQDINKVFVMFEAGDYNCPVYFGVKGNSELHDIQVDTAMERLVLTSITVAPVNPEIGDVYYNSTSKLLFIWDGLVWGNSLSPQLGQIYSFNSLNYIWDLADLVKIGTSEKHIISIEQPDPAIYKIWFEEIRREE